jgi:hypothetical protein
MNFRFYIVILTPVQQIEGEKKPHLTLADRKPATTSTAKQTRK